MKSRVPNYAEKDTIAVALMKSAEAYKIEHSSADFLHIVNTKTGRRLIVNRKDKTIEY